MSRATKIALLSVPLAPLSGVGVLAAMAALLAVVDDASVTVCATFIGIFVVCISCVAWLVLALFRVTRDVTKSAGGG